MPAKSSMLSKHVLDDVGCDWKLFAHADEACDLRGCPSLFGEVKDVVFLGLCQLCCYWHDVSFADSSVRVLLCSHAKVAALIQSSGSERHK